MVDQLKPNRSRNSEALGRGKYQTSADYAHLRVLVAERYDSIELLVERPNKTVWSAICRKDRFPVKLVIRKPSKNEENSPRLREVIEVVRSTPAAQLVPIRDVWDLPDHATVIETEAVPGKTLEEIIETARRGIVEDTVVNWMSQVCQTMAMLASQGIVHRNLKPANILIDSDQMARIDSFEMSTFAGDAYGPVGTPAYASPEHVNGKDTVDERSDIYSVGATFYHAVTGKRPQGWPHPVFEGAEPKTPESNRPNCRAISERTLSILRRCLREAPHDRFQSFVELNAQLENPNRLVRLLCRPPRITGYHLQSCLGEGGMGTVYRAWEVKGRRQVAIKVIRSLYGSELGLLARFRIEAEAVACLRHENIVPVREIGVSEGIPFMVLTYESGGNLKEAIPQYIGKQLWAATMAAGIAKGLHHSHRLGILHRDLKPHNVLLTSDGVPRITDFGLAKFTLTGKSRERLRDESILPGIQGSLLQLQEFPRKDIQQQDIVRAAHECFIECDPALAETISEKDVVDFVATAVRQIEETETEFLHEPTREGELLGTPFYMAPEQTLGSSSAYGPETDIYAVGVILYEMLTGKPPFVERNLNTLFTQIRTQEPAPPPRKVPRLLSDICMRCLAKPKEERFASAKELAEALDSFIREETSEQRRLTFWRRIFRR